VQVLRWQSTSTEAHSPGRKRARTSASYANASNADAGSRRQLAITLPDEQQVPVALAVLAALYGVKPIPELLSELSQEQQLHAAVLADMWQIDAVSTAAVQLLQSAAKKLAGLSAAASKQLLSMPAYPEPLAPLVEVVLFSKLGDVEAVWGDAELQELLLGLPLAAMKLLLSRWKLKVMLYECWRHNAIPVPVWDMHSHGSWLCSLLLEPISQSKYQQTGNRRNAMCRLPSRAWSL